MSIESLTCNNLYNICLNGSNYFYIDNYRREHEVNQYKFQYYFAQNIYCLKVEGLENYFKQYLPKTVHIYISPKNSKSFKTHQDPDDVTIKLLYGKKSMIINDEKITIEDSFTIKANTPHSATNEFDSVILSIA